jgi:hypothetical protein
VIGQRKDSVVDFDLHGLREHADSHYKLRRFSASGAKGHG